MSGEKEQSRQVWSWQLFQLPQEDETERLEESLREKKLTFWEDAELLRRYIHVTGMSQSACAKALGRSQAFVANRLRVLKLPDDIRKTMQREKFTERHARALLRLRNEEERRAALASIIQRKLTVAETEAYIESVLSSPEPIPERAPLLTSLLSVLETLQQSEPEIGIMVNDTGSSVQLSINIPKKLLK